MSKIKTNNFKTLFYRTIKIVRLFLYTNQFIFVRVESFGQ